MKYLFGKIKNGFTLIELLVVIALIAILASILVPAVTNALDQGKMTTVMNNGKNIYLSIYARNLENPLDQSPAWPTREITSPANQENIKNGEFNNSTEYFKWVIDAQIMNVDYSFFAAPEMPAENSTNSTLFGSDNNAWAVTVGVGQPSFKDGGPALFTKNIKQTGGIPLGSVNDPPALDPDELPFGDKGGVVVLQGGSALILKQDTLTNRFNRVDAANDVLYP